MSETSAGVDVDQKAVAARVPTEPEFGYLEADELFKHPAASVVGTHPGREAFSGGTISHVDGIVHQERRRLLSALFTEAATIRLERDVLVPAIELELDRTVGKRELAEPVHIDLMFLMESVFWQFAAAIVGLDDVSTADSAQTLQRTVRAILEGVDMDSLIGDPSEHHRSASAARARFDEQYFDVSFERRKALVENAERGRLPREELPNDLITLMLGANHDRQLVLNEATIFLGASNVNTPNTVASCVSNLEGWFGGHPEDRAKCVDDTFLRGALEETLRLRGSTHLRVRNLVADGTLRSSGRPFRAGDQFVVDLSHADRDTTVFGADADSFDPFRAERLAGRAKAYGLAFGGGPHLCLGRALALGDRRTERSGLLLPMLRALYQHGVLPDADEPPTLAAKDPRRYDRFPALLSGRV